MNEIKRKSDAEKEDREGQGAHLVDASQGSAKGIRQRREVRDPQRQGG
jgi:hypothetical protein